jgi:hypothetical protein
MQIKTAGDISLAVLQLYTQSWRNLAGMGC